MLEKVFLSLWPDKLEYFSLARIFSLGPSEQWLKANGQ
jgi:hypothetical protein